jgi:hypothetical protein
MRKINTKERKLKDAILRFFDSEITVGKIRTTVYDYLAGVGPAKDIPQNFNMVCDHVFYGAVDDAAYEDVAMQRDKAVSEIRKLLHAMEWVADDPKRTRYNDGFPPSGRAAQTHASRPEQAARPAPALRAHLRAGGIRPAG